jgi:hypothetical protein
MLSWNVQEKSMATEPAKCTFVVKEDRNNRSFIAIEPSVAGLDIAFTLIDGARREHAVDLARHMNRVIHSLSVIASEPYVVTIVEQPTPRQ